MKSFSYYRQALGAWVFAVVLTGCGGLQSMVGAPAVPNAGRSVVSSYQVLYNFQGGSDGSSPLAEEAPLLVIDGLLYGTTDAGGSGCTSGGCGTVFQATPSGSENVLYSFKGQPDGQSPTGTLIALKGIKYGMTASGGTSNNGVVFAIDTSGNERVIYNFKGGLDGSEPFGRLIAYKGTLYGTTVNGGRDGLGTVFSLATSGTERVLHSFKFHSDGAHPYAGLTALNGTLYGTTISGGPFNYGTVFAIGTSGAERVVYDFKYGRDGVAPQAPLIVIAGKLYGTTTDGGGTGHLGTVFEVSTSGVERVLHRFRRTLNDGEFPQSALVNIGGTLYGATPLGGRYGNGVVFSLNLSDGKRTILHNFAGNPDGQYPTGGLVAIKNVLYGTTSYGGTGRCNCGTIFALTP